MHLVERILRIASLLKLGKGKALVLACHRIHRYRHLHERSIPFKHVIDLVLEISARRGRRCMTYIAFSKLVRKVTDENGGRVASVLLGAPVADRFNSGSESSPMRIVVTCR